MQPKGGEASADKFEGLGESEEAALEQRSDVPDDVKAQIEESIERRHDAEREEESGDGPLEP